MQSNTLEVVTKPLLTSVCRCLQLCHGLNVTKAPSGVIVTSQEKVLDIKGFAKVYLVLQQSNRDFERQWQEAYTKVRAQIARNKDSRYNSITLRMATDIYKQYAVIEMSDNHRSKRNILGSALSWLTGMPSQEDIDGLKKVNEYLSSQMSKVIHDQGKTIATVNKLGVQQKQMANKVNHLVTELGTITAGVTTLQQDQASQAIMISLLRLQNSLTNYQLVKTDMRTVRAACESDSHSEVTIPPSTLRDILTGEGNYHDMPTALYYQYIHTESIIRHEGRTLCVIRVPLARKETHVLYHVSVFPVCGKTGCLTIYRDAEVVRGLQTEEVYFPEVCIGQSPQMCQAGVIHEDTAQPCIHGILANDKEQMMQCPVTISKQPPVARPVSTKVMNLYVVQTPSITYRYRCPNQNPIATKLPAGVYIIQVDPLCNLDAGIWLLKGLPVRELWLEGTVQPAQPIHMDFLDLSFNITLPAGESQLEFDSYHALTQSTGLDLGVDTRVNEMQEAIGKHHLKWLWVATGIMGGIGIIALTWHIYTSKLGKEVRNRCPCKCKSTPLAEKIEPTTYGTPQLPQADSALYPNKELETVVTTYRTTSTPGHQV